MGKYLKSSAQSGFAVTVALLASYIAFASTRLLVDASNGLVPLEERLRKDPQFGSELPKEWKGGSDDKVLVFLSGCACNREVLVRLVELGKKCSLTVVIAASPAKAREVSAGLTGLNLVFDSDLSYLSRLNAFFLPRVYGYRDNKLYWIQLNPGQSLDQAVFQACSAVNFGAGAKKK